MPHGAKAALAAALTVASGRRVVWIARDAEIADRVAEELGAWLGDPARVVTLEPRTALAYERSELVRDESAARVAALARWHATGSDAPSVLVASAQALFQRTIDPARIPEQPLVLRAGQRLAQRRVLEALVALGYETVPEVGGRGEVARRGGIVDVFPAGQPLPVRIEWFGDEIESLRAFDPADQRGTGPVADATLLPASEFLLDADLESALAERLGRAAQKLPESLATDLARLSNGDARRCRRGLGRPPRARDRARPPRRRGLGPRRARRGVGRDRVPLEPGGRATRGARAGRRAATEVAGGVSRAARLEAAAP